MKAVLHDTFRNKVLEVVRKIPEGEVLSYRQVAERAGSPHAARVVGSIMKKNFDPTVPCHRVVKSNGVVGDYNRGGREIKLKLLRKEEALEALERLQKVSKTSNA